MGVLPKLFKLWPWVDHDPFTPRSNLVTYAFVWEKVKLVYFLETIAALGLKGA